jgi:hypothetical protein
MALIDDLVSYWLLDETTGTRVDEHGSNNLTDNGGVSGTSGVATFDGSNDYLNIASNASLQMGNIDFSIVYFFRASSVSGARGHVAKTSAAGGTTWEYYCRTNGTTLEFNISDGTNNGTASTTIANSTWYFVTAIHDSVNNELRLYVDGTLVDTETWTTGGLVSSGAFALGARPATSYAHFFAGDMDLVGIWKRALTPAEITDLFNGGDGRDYAYIEATGGGGAIEGSITDGLTLGDSPTRRAALLASITDGLSVGETRQGRASFTTAISDSATFSDTSSARAAFIAAAADGVTFADTDSGRTTARTVIADGLTLGDSLAVAAVLSALVADGLTLAEVVDGQLAGALTALIADGITLGDTPTALARLFAIASDGTAFGDSVLAVLNALASVSDGVTFGDNAIGDILSGVLTALITDGLAFGDTGTVQASLLASVSDGVQFGETLQAVTALLAAVSDGFTLGDITITIEAAGVVRITFTGKQSSISFTIKQPGAAFSAKQPGVSFTGDA